MGRYLVCRACTSQTSSIELASHMEVLSAPIVRSPLIFGGRMSNMSDFTAGLLTNEDILAVSEFGIRPHMLHSKLSYKGVKLTLSKCDSNSTFQSWIATVSDSAIDAIRLHVTYADVDICMRLMVWHAEQGDCDSKQNNTGMDLYPCTTSHCDGHSNAWLLPSEGLAAPVLNAWSHH